MAKLGRHKTKYPGVYYIVGKHVPSEKPERIYYIRYRKDGKLIEEKVGRSIKNKMTEAQANRIRGRRIDGNEASNQEQRLATKGAWTFDRIWEEYKTQKSTLKGLRIDCYRYDKHLKPSFGAKEPGDIVTLDVDRLRMRKLKGQAPQSKKLILSLLKRIIRFGVQKGLCPPPDPAKLHIEIPRVDNVKTEDLSPAQLKRLLKAIDASPNTAIANMMRLALFLGLRRGEILKLQWRDIDFKGGFILLRDPKGGKTESVPLNDAAREVLKSHPKAGSPYVFPGRNGKQRTTVTPQVNKIKKAAKLPKDFRPLHGLRHVFASMLASSGEVDMFTLQKLLTHKSPAMTQRYAHLRDEALKRATQVTDNIIAKIGK